MTLPSLLKHGTLTKPDQSGTFAQVGVENIWLARQRIGSATVEGLWEWAGINNQVQWQSGIDDANTPKFSDYVLADRAETWDAAGEPLTVSDFLVLRNGHSQSNPPRLGVGIYPQDASNGTQSSVPGMLEVGIYGTANGLAFTNFVARVQTSQTGFLFAGVNTADHPVFTVGTDGTVNVNDSSNNPQVTLSQSAGIASTHAITSKTEITARFTDAANVTIMGEVGPSSQPGLQVVDAGTTWYRASSYKWQTPGYVTINRNVTIGGSANDNEVVLTVLGHGATQTADLQDWQTNAVTTFAITAAGLPKWTAAGNQQTTVGAAGGASALPATPTKYLKVVDSTGTTYVIPAYAAV